MPSSEPIDAASACDRYEAIRARLPAARFPDATRQIDSLGDLMDEIDAFVLDGFGVLNVGETAVPGAVERIAQLRAAGKALLVLTNSATYPAAELVARYGRLGFDVAPDEIVSSRDVLAEALKGEDPATLWGVAATPRSAIEDLAPRAVLLGDAAADYARVDGFVLLSSGDWCAGRQALLVDALAARPRPVLVGNPDLVAPREDSLSREPGFYAHQIADRAGAAPRFFGKPFGAAFALARERIGAAVPPARIAMIGDTLHTDILGGAAAGWRTVLVAGWGLMKDLDIAARIRSSGVRPDFIAATT